jgi:hypothetical protein
MSTPRVPDEPLRVRALDALGALGEALAREALETGSVEVEHDVLAWEGSHGTVHAHRVIVSTSEALRDRIVAHHAAMDGLCAALSTAMAERAGHSVADVRIEIGGPTRPNVGPYRT